MKDVDGELEPEEQSSWKNNPWVQVLIRLSRDRGALAGLLLVLGLYLVGILAPWIAPYSYTAQNLDAVERPPSWQHWLGTDQLGRDLLSRIIIGARMASLVSVLVVSISVVLGTTMGAMAGYFRGWVDTAIMRLVDLLFAFPDILLALFLAATLRPPIEVFLKQTGLGIQPGMLGFFIVIIVLSVVGWGGWARLVRGQVMTMREREFADAARAMGATDWRILIRHLLPNSLTPMVVALFWGLGGAIGTEATLSFLGLGIQPPEASWGLMINENFSMWRVKPHLVLAPGITLLLVVTGFILVADGLNDALNPRRRKR